jgi:hypothetical protein
VNNALTAISTPEQAADLTAATVQHLLTSRTLIKVGHDAVRQRSCAFAAAIAKAVAAEAPVLRRSWDARRQVLTPSAGDTTDTLMRALTTHALTSDCFGAPGGTSTLPGRLRMLLRSALVPSSGSRNRTKADAETVAEVRNARFHPSDPRVLAQAGVRGERWLFV